MIHGHKIKIKSLREDLREIEKELYETQGQLQREKQRLGFVEWNNLNRKKEFLLRNKNKLKASISTHKRKIRLIKDKKNKRKK